MGYRLRRAAGAAANMGMDFDTFEKLFLAKIELERSDRREAINRLSVRLEEALQSIGRDLETQKELVMASCKQPPREARPDFSSEMAELRKRLEETKNQFLRDLSQERASRRSAVEHAVVGAGMLALAASESLREERSWFAERLAEHRDYVADLADAAHERPTVLPVWMCRWASERIESAKLSKGWQPKTGVEVREEESFVVEVDRTFGDPLGLTVRSDDLTDLIVDEVSEGLLKDWGRQQNGRIVKPGDRIVEINGVRGDYERLAKEAGKETRLVISVRRTKT